MLTKSIHKLIVLLLVVTLGSCNAQPSPLVPTVALDQPEETAAFAPSSCTVVGGADREEFLTDSPFDPASEADWQSGPEDASVTLIEYSDFQCPFCAQLSIVLAELEASYPDDLRVIYRHFPLIGSTESPIHDKAALAAQASEAAGAQGKFWQMHDHLFANQAEWSTMSTSEFESWLQTAPQALDLDLAQFTADLQSTELEQLAQNAWVKGQELEISGTPFVLINGIPYSGPTDLTSLDTIIQLELLRERQFSECPEMALQPGAGYTATVHTEKGDIVIELSPEAAPMAVNSFIFLAEHDWFDHVTFHRVLPGFVAQAGDPTGTGYGGPGYAFAIEVDSNLVFDRPGLLAMANSGPTANGSQFFITLGPAGHLNGQFTIFGEVIQGMTVVESLTPRDPSQSVDLPPGDLILDVSIEVH
ncbi:MAG: peptidylprolyl isomerase [Anaerolineales bacterium]